MLTPGFYLFEISADILGADFTLRIAGYVDEDDPKTGYKAFFNLHSVEAMTPSGQAVNITDTIENLNLTEAITEIFYETHL
ncbi:hypothetical protein V6R21_30505 [Limibacter armeniacum]|uniref:hypothetical protein n=1 Tax=Limibacter armeniacum TaxID=466084 RepID=UPI002FE6A388